MPVGDFSKKLQPFSESVQDLVLNFKGLTLES